MAEIKSRNFGLDVVRAISIALVFISHRFDIPYELGLVGVQVFFVLSGFLIGQILLKEFKSGIDFGRIVRFWKRRWLRIVPLYYFVLIAKMVIYGNPYGWKIIAYFLFLQANVVGIKYLPVSWSLVVEEWFYIFLPIALFIVVKLGVKFTRYLNYLLLIIVLVFTARFLWNYFGKGVIIYQFDCLIIGVVFAYIKMTMNEMYERLKGPLFFLIGLCSTIYLALLSENIHHLPMIAPFYKVTWCLLLSVSVSFMIPFIESNSIINVELKKVRPIYYIFTWTSILTYSIYLLHMELFRIPVWHLGIFTLPVQIFLLYTICLIVYALFESPMLSLRESFSIKQYLKTIKNFSFKV